MTSEGHEIFPAFPTEFEISQDDDVFSDKAQQFYSTKTLKSYSNNDVRLNSTQTVHHQNHIRHEIPTYQPSPPKFNYQPNSTKSNVSQTTNSLAHAPKMINGVELVPKYNLPDRFQAVFEYEMFNAVQSKCFEPAFKSDDNMVLSAPTGSGKTVVMELAVCKLVGSYEPGTFKAIYMAPTKSLCVERKRDWEKKFSHIGIKCTEMTGDTDYTQLSNVKNGDIIITTPEKWDSMTRKWQDHRKLLELVRLLMVRLDSGLTASTFEEFIKKI